MGYIRLLWPLGLMVLLCACSREKEPAQQAFAQVQAAVEPVSADLEKYAPEEYGKLNDLVGQMRTKLNDGDYHAVLVLRAQAMSQLILTSGETAKRKLQMNRKLAADWQALSVAVPKLISDVSARAAALHGAKKLPADVSAASLAQAEAQIPSLNAGWKSILDMAKTGSTDVVTAKAQELKKQCVQIGALLGMKLQD